MTLLTQEEVEYQVIHISTEPVDDWEKVHDILVEAGAAAQLGKVIQEIDKINETERTYVLFRRKVENWLKAAKKELA